MTWTRLKSVLRLRFSEIYLYLRKGSARVARKYARYRSRLPIAGKTVLFEAYHGARISCVPYAIFKAMLEDPDFKDFRFVWTFNPHDDGSNLIHSMYERHPRVKFCRRHSNAYLRHLASAKYLVNNKTFHHYFAKRPEQVHVSSWHATAFKTLGKDQYGSMGQYGNVTRNYLQTDYLVMPNRFTADVLLDSCDVRSVFPGVVVDAGYPRSDLTIRTDPAEMRHQLVELLGIDPARKIVLYAPTWRGEVGAAIDTSDVIAENISVLSSGLPDGYQLLLKVHDRAYQFAKANPALAGLANVPDWMETNELLAAVDILITDYSSICFDFLCMGRPIIHYVFDRDEYERTRGLYFDMEKEMAGPLCYTADEVNAAISNIDQVFSEYRAAHARLVERLAYNEDGRSSRRVLDIVFRGRGLEYTYRVEDTTRTRVLAYLGTIGPCNSRILDALSGLDFEAIDLVLLFDGAPTKLDEYYLTRMHPEIKVFYCAPTPMRSSVRQSVEAAVRMGGESRYLSPDVAIPWREEILGYIPFDVAIDFQGKTSIWQLAFAHTRFKKKIVFLPEPSSADRATFSLDLASAYFDVLACATRESFDFYSARLKGTPLAGEVVLCPLPVGIDRLAQGLRADVAHLLGGLGHCVDCATASLDPHCETGDLLFEFRVGGVARADLREHPVIERALEECASGITTGLNRVASECDQQPENQFAREFASLFAVDASAASRVPETR